MADKGIDALVLLSNANVSYATGATWPLSDAGRGNVERPVAVVLADDPLPHLFTPFLADAAGELELDDDHLHGPTYLDLEEGVRCFAGELADLLPEHRDGRLRRGDGGDARERDAAVRRLAAAGGERGDGSGSHRQDARRARLPAPRAVDHRAGHGARSRPSSCPVARQVDLTATFLHRVFELGAEANVLDPIWQVMPARQADLPWTVHGDIACPLLSTERVLAEGDVLWVDTGIMYGGYHSDFGRTWVVGSEPTARQQAQFARWREINDAVVAVMRAGVAAADLTAAAREVCGGDRAVDGALLPRPRARPRQRRGAVRRDRPGRRLRPRSLPRRRHRARRSSRSCGTRATAATGPKTSFVITDDGCVNLRPTTPTTRMATEPLPDPPGAAGLARRERAFAADGGARPRRAACSGASPTSATCRVCHCCGTPARARSALAASSCAPPATIHLLSTWDEGVPDEIPHDHLYGITWNPMNLVAVLQRHRRRRRPHGAVGTDAMSPVFAHLLPKVFPDVGHRRRRVRRCAPPDASRRPRRSTRSAPPVDVADAALAAAVAELRPGVTERELTGVFMDAMALAGVTTPATQDVGSHQPRPAQPGRTAPRRAVRDGDLVAFDAGVVARRLRAARWGARGRSAARRTECRTV